MITIYTPNAKRELERLDYRMIWEDEIRNYLLKLNKTKPVIMCGDLNVAHNEIDLKNPKSNRKNAGFTDEERNKMTKLLDNGIGIYSKEWFYPIHYITRKKVILPNTHTIHYYAGTWAGEKRLGFFGKIFATYFNSPLYQPIEEMTARGYRWRINSLLKKAEQNHK